MGNSLAQYRVAIGMHKIYLTSREYRDCFKGKFWCSLLLLFYLEAIYLPVLKLQGKVTFYTNVSRVALIF